MKFGGERYELEGKARLKKADGRAVAEYEVPTLIPVIAKKPAWEGILARMAKLCPETLQIIHIPHKFPITRIENI